MQTGHYSLTTMERGRGWVKRAEKGRPKDANAVQQFNRERRGEGHRRNAHRNSDLAGCTKQHRAEMPREKLCDTYLDRSCR